MPSHPGYQQSSCSQESADLLVRSFYLAVGLVRIPGTWLMEIPNLSTNPTRTCDMNLAPWSLIVSSRMPKCMKTCKDKFYSLKCGRESREGNRQRYLEKYSTITIMTALF